MAAKEKVITDVDDRRNNSNNAKRVRARVGIFPPFDSWVLGNTIVRIITVSNFPGIIRDPKCEDSGVR